MDNILLISDLHGTLLNSCGKLTEINRQAICSFREDGGIFTIATSHSEHVLIPLLEKLPLSFPLILHNGALLYDPIKRRHLNKQYLPVEPLLLEKLLNFVYSSPVSILFFIGDQIYTIRRDQTVRFFEERIQHQTQLLQATTDFSKLIKILISSPYQSLLEEIKKAIFIYNVECESYYTKPGCLEILPFNVNKGKALLDISHFHNLAPWKIYSVGDSIADFSLFEVSDKSYIVENSHPRLKMESFVQTVSNDEHAVAKVIEEIRGEH